MEKKENYKFIEGYKNVIYGIDKGFQYLDYLTRELRKQESWLGTFKVYDYKKDEYFFVNKENINFLVQKIYLSFLSNEQILKSEDYIRVYDNLIKKLKTTDIKMLSAYSLMLQLSFFLLKEMTLSLSVLENKISKSEFKNRLVQLLNKYLIEDTKLNTEMVKLIMDVLIEEKIVDDSYFSVSVSDLNLFSNMKYMRNQMVNVYSQENNIIFFNTNYAMSELYKVIINYTNNLNLNIYNNLFYILNIEKKIEIEKIKSFILDFRDIKLFPKDFKTKDQKALAIFEKIHFNKLILNEYCFNVLAVSCFDRYLFSKDKLDNILLQKCDPILNLNPNILIAK